MLASQNMSPFMAATGGRDPNQLRPAPPPMVPPPPTQQPLPGMFGPTRTRYAGSGSGGSAMMPSGPQPTGVSGSNNPYDSSWQPYNAVTTQHPLDYSAALAGYLSGGAGGGGGGGGLVEVHHPQDSFPYYHGGGVHTSANGGSGIGNPWGGDNAGGPSGGGGAGGPSGGFGGAGGGGGGAMSNTPLGSLVAEYQRAMNEHNAATQGLYNSNIAGYVDMWKRNMARLQGVGDQQKADLTRDFNNSGSQIDSNMIDRGMSSSTVRQNLTEGNTRERTDAMNRLQSSLNREAIGYDTQLQGNVLAQQERRQDTPPDFGQLAQLAQMLGMSTGGGGGGFAGGPVAPGAYGPDFSAMVNNGGFGGGGGGGQQGLNPFQQMLAAMNAAGMNPNGNAVVGQRNLNAQGGQGGGGSGGWNPIMAGGNPEANYLNFLSQYGNGAGYIPAGGSIAPDGQWANFVPQTPGF